MKSRTLNEFTQRMASQHTQHARTMLAEKKFDGWEAVIQWLARIVSQYLRSVPLEKSFEKALDLEPAIRSVLLAGDAYFVQLIRDNGFINVNTESLERTNPLTIVVSDFYQEINGQRRVHDERLGVYSELGDDLSRAVGELLAADPGLQKYEHWEKMMDEDFFNHELARSWRDHLPTSSIEKEHQKFDRIPDDMPLHEMAMIGGLGRDNEALARYHIKHMEELKDSSHWHFVKEAAMGMQLFSLKEDSYFRQNLLKRLSMRHWLKFTESFRYLCAQDHMFLYLDRIEEYESVVQLIAERKQPTDAEQHLLLTALTNYFDFLTRTIQELENIAKGYNGNWQADIEVIKGEAQTEANRWLSQVIPDSFTRMLDAIFPKASLHSSPFFMGVFEWLSHYQLTGVRANAESVFARTLNSLRDTWQEKFKANLSDAVWLAEHLSEQQLSFNAFAQLVDVFYKNPANKKLRDKLFARYQSYIASDFFRWTKKGDAQADYVYDCAYHFSVVLAAYKNPFEKWLEVYGPHAIHHQGWLTTRIDYKLYEREPYLFTAGFGIAYYYYDDGKPSEAEAVLRKVMNILLQQYRSRGEYGKVDYDSALQMAAVIIGKFAPALADWFLTIVVTQLDKITEITRIAYELSLYIPATNVAGAKVLREYIEQNFWKLEESKSMHGVGSQLQYYRKLRDLMYKWVDGNEVNT